MKKAHGLFLAFLVLLATPALAKKTTYIATNHRLNFVKLIEVSVHEASSREMTHPVDVDEGKVRELLSSIRFSKRTLLGKETQDRAVFSESAIDFLAFNLSKAFREATPNEEVVFSYLDKDPIFILRNDRLTIASAWIHDKDLHIAFKKFWAKVEGDLDKRGGEEKAAARAKGVRLSLEVGPGQAIAAGDNREIILSLSGEAIGKAGAEASPDQATDDEQGGAEEKPTRSSTAPATNPNVKGRLQALEELKRQGLISTKEYEEKRKQILKDL